MIGVDSKGNPLQGGGGLVDVDVTEKSDECEATSEERESFNDSIFRGKKMI